MQILTLETFAEPLKAKFSLPGSASPEDQLKPPVADLIKDTGTAFKLAVESRTETHLSDHRVRPDIAIYVDMLICGYVELKAPGLGADPARLKGKHNKDQWDKLKSLPNLIYTDGRDWALYRNGERHGGLVRLDDDPTAKGKAAVTKDDAADGGGIVTFITASSYLGGPGFKGMREYMRREFDELYIVNLGGDLLGTRKTPNVFNIQTPVTISIGFRNKMKSNDQPASVKYCCIEAETRADKLIQIDALTGFFPPSWTRSLQGRVLRRPNCRSRPPKNECRRNRLPMTATSFRCSAMIPKKSTRRGSRDRAAAKSGGSAGR